MIKALTQELVSPLWTELASSQWAPDLELVLPLQKSLLGQLPTGVDDNPNQLAPTPSHDSLPTEGGRLAG
jgi:hypothetical protein